MIAARRTYRLPYFHARMRAERAGDRIEYSSRRIDSRGRLRRSAAATGRSGRPSTTTCPEARRALLRVHERRRGGRGGWTSTTRRGRWRQADADIDAQGMADQIGIRLEGEPLLNFAARQDTLLWPLKTA